MEGIFFLQMNRYTENIEKMNALDDMFEGNGWHIEDIQDGKKYFYNRFTHRLKLINRKRSLKFCPTPAQFGFRKNHSKKSKTD